MTSYLLPEAILQVGQESFGEISHLAIRLVTVGEKKKQTCMSAIDLVVNVSRDTSGRSGWLDAGEHPG